MNKKLLVNSNTQIIENIILIGDNFQLPMGFEIVDVIPGASIGDKIENGELIKKEVPDVEPTIEEMLLAAYYEIAELKARLEALEGGVV